jgi:hypothetical protein
MTIFHLKKSNFYSTRFFFPYSDYDTILNVCVLLFSVYVDGILRGTRRLLLKEARCISNALRREYPKMFAVSRENGKIF